MQPLRVAYLANQYPLVSHTFIRREIAAVERTGAVEIVRYAIRSGALGFVDPADRMEAEKTKVVLHAGLFGLALASARVALGSPWRFLRALARAVAIGLFSDRGLLRHFAYLAEACALRQALRSDRIEHVHVHFGTNAAAVAMLCRELGGPPYSLTIHGPLEFEKAPRIALSRKIEQAAFVVAITHYCRSQVWRHCEPQHWSKVHVVTCGVDEAYLERTPAPIEPAPRLVFVGRLADHKAPGLLVEAAAQLRREGIAFEIVFVGDGELRPQIEAGIRHTGLGEQVRVLGFSDEETVREHIRRARALVLPSLAEGLPVVLMEALALGRPVVSTFIAGIPELVEPGRSGWLVPAASLEHLTEALKEVLAAPVERLEAMGRAGRARVLELHDARTSGRLLSELFIRSFREAPFQPRRSPTGAPRSS